MNAKGGIQYYSSFRSQEFEVDIERQSVGDKTKELPTLVLTVPNEKDEVSSKNSKFPVKDGKQFLPVRLYYEKFILYSTISLWQRLNRVILHCCFLLSV